MQQVSRVSKLILIESKLKKNRKGSFGIGFKGNFRGNIVAIKKLKTLAEKQMDEVDKEAMLKKFWNEYIIHLYGYVSLGNEHCIITEYAQHGSLLSLIEDGRQSELNERMKFEIHLDSTRGLKYLHVDGIVQRDNKTDNLMIVSLEENDDINWQLTEF